MKVPAKFKVCVLVSRLRFRFPERLERLELHDLNMRHARNPNHSVRMDQPVRNSRVHNPPPDKVQDIRPIHHYHRLRQFHHRAPVEPRLRRQLQPSLPEDPAHTILVTARHQQPLLRLVRRGVDEIQQTLPMSSESTNAPHKPHRPETTTGPPGPPSYPDDDTPDR